jgi:general secretion pathway protein G
MVALTVSGREMLTCQRSSVKGFTLIELMVVMTIIALLLSLAVPRYFHSLDKAREATLRQDLDTMRDAIDKFRGDSGRYPISLEELVARKYLRDIPPDPITGNASSWVVISSDTSSDAGVYDVKSGAQGIAAGGSRYGDW